MVEGHTVLTPRTREVWKKILAGSERVFEIGFNQGHSAQLFLDLGCTVHSVDINPECLGKMQKLAERYEKFSYEIKDSRDLKASQYQDYDLVFVDGMHEASAIMKDLNFAYHIRAKYIAVDDYGTDPWFYWIPDVITKIQEKGFPYQLKEVYTYDATGGENKVGLLCQDDKWFSKMRTSSAGSQVKKD